VTEVPHESHLPAQLPPAHGTEVVEKVGTGHSFVEGAHVMSAQRTGRAAGQTGVCGHCESDDMQSTPLCVVGQRTLFCEAQSADRSSPTSWARAEHEARHVPSGQRVSVGKHVMEVGHSA
jgi:hypothetical protein